MKKDFKKPILALAPMAGYTDLPFRILCKENGADLVYSEMISAASLFYHPKNEKTLALAETIKKEQPVAFQLFGNDPKHFAKATKILSRHLKKHRGKSAQNFIDINFGCPVKKVIKQGSGCALMKEPQLARKIIQAVLENTDLPVSIKLRAGIGKFTATGFLKEVSDLDWKIAMIHGRTFEQGFSGPIDLAMIKKIKKMFPDKIILANGGINSPEIAKKVLFETGADGIGIGQGALGDPWIFSQIKDYLKTGKYRQPDLKTIKKTVLKHSRLFEKYRSEKYIPELRKHLIWYFHSTPNAKNIRKELVKVSEVSEVKKILKQI